MNNDPFRAVICVGSNSIRMLTARIRNKMLYDEVRYRDDVRTYKGLDDGALSRDMIERVVKSVIRMMSAAAAAEVECAALTSTSVMRDAANASAFMNQLYDVTGMRMRVLSGEDEARLGFTGACCGKQGGCGLLDIGGGSTEIAIGSDGKAQAQISLQLGAARNYHNDYTTTPIKTILADYVNQIKAARASLTAPPPDAWVGVGGTFHTLAKISRGGDPNVEGRVLSRDDLLDMAYDLFEATPAQRASTPGLPLSRADIIVPGALIALAAATALEIESIEVTERGNLDGCLLYPPEGLIWMMLEE